MEDDLDMMEDDRDMKQQVATTGWTKKNAPLYVKCRLVFVG